MKAHKKEMVTAQAPGKLMLLGEHAVVYGRNCIVTAVDAPVRASVSPSDEFYFDARDLGFSQAVDVRESDFPKQVAFAAFAVKNFCERFSITAPVRIATESIVTAGRKVGLGSSASVTAATIVALSHFHSKNMSRQEMFELAFKTVLDVQKVGSGFDVAAAIYGGTLLYRRGEPAPLKCDKLGLVIGYTGIPASTVDIVRQVAESIRNQPDYYEGLFDEINRIVINGKKAIESENWQALGELMNQNQEILRKFRSPSESCGVSSEILESLIKAALDAGAYGAKLSGAGVGDCMISLAPEEKQESVADAITKAGGTVISCLANVPGARIMGEGN